MAAQRAENSRWRGIVARCAFHSIIDSHSWIVEHGEVWLAFCSARIMHNAAGIQIPRELVIVGRRAIACVSASYFTGHSAFARNFVNNVTSFMTFIRIWDAFVTICLTLASRLSSHANTVARRHNTEQSKNFMFEIMNHSYVLNWIVELGEDRICKMIKDDRPHCIRSFCR